jgi:hypothetical protein
MKRYFLLAGVLCLSALLLPAQTFTALANGHTYQVTVNSISNSGRSVASGSASSRFFYTPAAILPSAQTGGYYDVLFASNIDMGTTPTREAVFLTQSLDGKYGFSDPVQILTQAGTNICDMTAPRAIWDDNFNQWHVFVQAVIGTVTSCPYPTGPAYIFEAVGPSLSLGSLQWVMSSPGVAKPIVQSICAANARQNSMDPAQVCNGANNAQGIGQEFQAFNVGKYTGLSSSWPYMLNYNDYSYQVFGQEVFGYLSPWNDGANNYYYWYDTQPASKVAQCGGYEVLNPDVILANSLEESTSGDPSIAIGSDQSCSTAFGSALAFWSTLVPYYFGSYVGSIGAGPDNALGINSKMVAGTFPSSGNGIDDPKFARNNYGYLEPTPGVSPTTWHSYIYYGVKDFGTWKNQNPGEPGGFRVSEVIITEQ